MPRIRNDQLVNSLRSDFTNTSPGGGGASVAHPYLTVSGVPDLTNERILTAGDGLASTDGGANGNFTIDLGTPGTLSAASSNDPEGGHTHAISASSDPGESSELLKTTVDGLLSLHELQMTGDSAGTDNFISQLTGWRIDYDGDADFRNIFADELRVRAFIADIEQALAGGQIVSKSVALLSRDFEIPLRADIVEADSGNDWVSVDGDRTDLIDPGQTFEIANSTGNDGTYTVSAVTYVNPDTRIDVNEDITSGADDGEVRFRRTIFLEDLPGFENVRVFEANDWVRLRVIDRSGGGLVVADVWGIVTSYSDLSGGEQAQAFTVRDDGGVAGNVVNAGALALDYGASGDGYWEVTVLDESGPTPGPYSQIVTWTSDPSDNNNHSLKTRLGYLGGVSDGDFSGISGYGLYSDNVYLKGEIQAASGDVVIDSGGITITPADNEGTAGSSSSSAINFLSGSDLLGQLISWGDAGVDDGIRLENLGNAYFSLRRNAVSGDTRAEISGLGSTGDVRLDGDTIIEGDLDLNGDADISGRGVFGSRLEVRRSAGSLLGLGLWDDSDNIHALIYSPADGELHLNLYNGVGGGAPINSVELHEDHVETDGDVGIGGTPSYRLDVQENTDGFAANFFNDGNAQNRRGIRIQCGPDSSHNATLVSLLDGNGDNLGVIRGDGAGGVDYISSSDERLKQDITAMSGSLAAVLALRPVEYRGKGASRSRAKVPGFVAQEVAQAIPAAAHHDEETDLYSLTWNKMIPFLVGAIQELAQRVEELESTA